MLPHLKTQIQTISSHSVNCSQGQYLQFLRYLWLGVVPKNDGGLVPFPFYPSSLRIN